MATYSYRARTADGQLRRGLVEGISEEAALRHIESLHLIPVQLQRKEEPRKGFLLPYARSRASLRDLVLFARQLQTVINAGISLTAGLGILAEQSGSQVLRDAVLAVKQDIESGSSLTEALSRQPAVFPQLIVNLAKAGEESGLLSEMLDRTADLLEYELENRARIRAAIFYPALVVSEMVLAIFVLLKFVLPRFAAFFSRFETELPLPTRILIAIGSMVEKNWHWGLIGVGIVVLLAVLILRTRGGIYQLHRLKLKTPILGPIFLKSIMSRFSRVLSALVGSGLPITESLGIVKGIVRNGVVEGEVEKMKESVIKGQGLATGLKDSKVFSPLIVKMIAVGEETGSLETMLFKASNYYDRDLDQAVKNLATAIEPILLVVLGVGVLFVALSIFLPMWNLMNAFRH